MRSKSHPALRLALVVAGASVLAACASTPKPAGPVAPSRAPESEAPPSTAPGYGGITQQQAPGVVPGSVQDFVINAGELVYFDLDSFTLRPDAKPVLDAQANWL
ncbi:MAG TPA: peptidoglycan-associated lipoprotein, partial [Caulobacteraceae bacterium]|nr:peptidoglycan-associated lipoprotein [Caulobacteraceae bacterium]